MPFILITSLLAQNFLLHFKNMVLELLALYELAKPGGKLIMKRDRESKAYISWLRMRLRMRLMMMLMMMLRMRTYVVNDDRLRYYGMRGSIYTPRLEWNHGDEVDATLEPQR